MINFFLYSCIFLFFGNCLFAQSFEENNFRLYTTKDGLSSDFISGIGQDSAGYMWISTYHGLNRFDGNTFKQFLRTSRYNSIPDNSVFSMNLLPNNQLAIATDNGVQILSTKTLEKKNFEISTEDELRYWSNYCKYVDMDDDGNLGISTKTGFYIFSSTGKLQKRFDRYTVKNIGHAWMMFGSYLYNLPDGNIMQENSSGFCYYDRRKNQICDVTSNYKGIKQIIRLQSDRSALFFISQYDVLVLNLKTNCFDIIDIRDGRTTSSQATFNFKGEIGWQTKLSRVNDSLWAINSEDKGFYLIHIDTARQKVSCYAKKYFSDRFCNNIFCDRHKRLWIGTNEGLFMENLHARIINSFPVRAVADNDNSNITSLFIFGHLIFVGTNKNEIIVLDKTSFRVLSHFTADNLSGIDNSVRFFELVHPDTLWVATNKGVLWLNIKNFSRGRLLIPGISEKNNQTLFLFGDKNKNVWIVQNSINSIIFYNHLKRKFIWLTDSTDPMLKVNLINSLAEDNQGNIWIGGDAIARWSPRLQKIDTLIERLSTQKNWKKGYIVMSDSKGDIWTMTNDDGIAKISGTKAPLHLRPENLLPDYSELMPALINDKIFLPTNHAIGFLDVRNFKSIVFNKTDGIPPYPITSFYFSLDHLNNSIWFASKNIIGSIPFIANDNYGESPELHITQITVLNDTVINYPLSVISLKYFQNNIRIDFSAVNFTDPQNIRFAYRIMNKNDTSWIETGIQQDVLLTNISPGNYKVEIKAYAYDNKWTQQISQVEIKILPPFWRRAWFLILVALVISGSIYYLYRNQVNNINQRANLDKALAQTEMKALHSQMNPHFIFNCLNSIREMILNNENQHASRYLSKFAHLIRMTLNQSSQPFISLQNTIDSIRRYIEMEQIRTSNFSNQIEVDEDLRPEEIFLPPMLIQPFIENAIWHGSSSKIQTMEIKIRFLQKNNELLCIIDDNGIGVEASMNNKSGMQIHHNPIGIANIRQRIQVLNEKYYLRCSLNIEDKKNLTADLGTGTIVTLRLPIKTTAL